jgi:PAS domain S-box-containing protein
MDTRYFQLGESARLARLHELFILDTPREPLFDSLVRMAADACGAPIAVVTLIDARRQWFKAEVGLGGLTETPREYAFCEEAIRSDELLEVADLRDDARFSANPFVCGEPCVRFYAGVPLVMPTGERLGTLCVLDRHVRRLDDVQRRTLASLAALATQALVMRRDLIERTISVRSGYEQALATNEAELSDLYANAPCGYYSLDENGIFVRINDTALRWLGCTREELCGKRHIADFLDADGRQYFNARFTRLKRDGRVFDIEYELVGRNGMRRRVRGSASALRRADGSFLMTRTVIHDISELHRARENLRQLGAEQQSIIDNDLVAIFKLKDRRVVWANKGAEKMFGCSLSDMVGNTTRHFYPDDAGYQEFGAASVPRLAAGAMYRSQMQLRHRDGAPVLVDANLAPMPGSPGEVLCVLVDISEIKRAEEVRIHANALEAENRQLVEAARVKGVFLSNMSHELYTPLNAIIGYSHLLGTGAIPADSPRFARYLADIGASGQQLLKQVQGMLTMADAEARRFDLRPQHVQLREVLEGVVDVAQADCHARELKLVLSTDPEPVALLIDPMRLAQVVSHLLSNAIRFSHRGGRIELRARALDEHEFLVEVEDRGTGIQPKDLPHLFTPFRQLNEGLARPHQGAGLGLALARRLVEAQGGTMAVRSLPGVGSTFSVTLPRVPTTPATPHGAA